MINKENMSKKLQISTFGSCLADQIADALLGIDSAATKLSKIYHYRSDQFCDYVIDERFDAISKKSFQAIVQSYENEKFSQLNRNCIKHQSKEFVDFFIKSIPYTDVFLFDNHMDVGAKLVLGVHPNNKNAPIFFRAASNIEERSELKFTNLLDLEKSHNGFRKVFAWIRSKNPNAYIFFVPYPGNPFAERGGQKRANRSAKYPCEFSDLGVFSFPHFFIPREYQDFEKGALYFKKNVYQEIAKCALFTIQAKGNDSALTEIYAQKNMSFDELLEITSNIVILNN